MLRFLSFLEFRNVIWNLNKIFGFLISVQMNNWENVIVILTDSVK